MALVKLDGYRCERCEHVWVPRQASEGLPTVCPRCKSPYWNTPRRADGPARKGVRKRAKP